MSPCIMSLRTWKTEITKACKGCWLPCIEQWNNRFRSQEMLWMLGWMRKAVKGEGRSQGRLPGGGHVWYMVWCVFVVEAYGVVVEEMMCMYMIPGVCVCGIWYMCVILGVCVWERDGMEVHGCMWYTVCVICLCGCMTCVIWYGEYMREVCCGDIWCGLCMCLLVICDVRYVHDTWYVCVIWYVVWGMCVYDILCVYMWYML